MSLLYSPVTLGPYTFKNRLVMSPMTRSRALGNVPDELMVEYYKQRASSAGLIVNVMGDTHKPILERVRTERDRRIQQR